MRSTPGAKAKNTKALFFASQRHGGTSDLCLRLVPTVTEPTWSFLLVRFLALGLKYVAFEHLDKIATFGEKNKISNEDKNTDL